MAGGHALSGGVAGPFPKLDRRLARSNNRLWKHRSPECSSFPGGSVFSFQGDSPNTLSLSALGVPEPSAATVLGLMLFGLMRRRRR